jgi:hypothetical protein
MWMAEWLSTDCVEELHCQLRPSRGMPAQQFHRADKLPTYGTQHIKNGEPHRQRHKGDCEHQLRREHFLHKIKLHSQDDSHYPPHPLLYRVALHGFLFSPVFRISPLQRLF